MLRQVGNAPSLNSSFYYSLDQMGERKAKCSKFHAWLEENGAEISNIELSWGNSPFAGWGMRARHSMSAGDIVYSIPEHLELGWKAALRAGLGSVANGIDESTVRSNPEMVCNLTVLLLAHERLRGEDSFYSSYLDLLPKSVDMWHMPFHFTEPEVALLRAAPSSFRAVSLAVRTDTRAVASIFADVKNDWAAKFNVQPWEVMNAVMWAASIFRCRGATPCRMVPFHDFVNHEHGGPVRLPEQHRESLRRHGPERQIASVPEGAWTMLAGRSISRGERVTWSYHDADRHCSDEWLISYGFVDASAATCLSIPLGIRAATDRTPCGDSGQRESGGAWDVVPNEACDVRPELLSERDGRPHTLVWARPRNSDPAAWRLDAKNIGTAMKYIEAGGAGLDGRAVQGCKVLVERVCRASWAIKPAHCAHSIGGGAVAHAVAECLVRRTLVAERQTARHALWAALDREPAVLTGDVGPSTAKVLLRLHADEVRALEALIAHVDELAPWLKNVDGSR
jgi:hypothetical protein